MLPDINLNIIIYRQYYSNQVYSGGSSLLGKRHSIVLVQILRWPDSRSKDWYRLSGSMDDGRLTKLTGHTGRYWKFKLVTLTYVTRRKYRHFTGKDLV